MDEKLEEKWLRSLGKTNLQSRKKEHKVISREWNQMLAKVRPLKFRARDCNRKKDLLHLLFSYPVKPEADQADLLLLRDNFIKLSRMTKGLDATTMEKVPRNSILAKLIDRDIPAVLKDVENRLAKYDFDFDLSQVRPQSLTRMTERLDATMRAKVPPNPNLVKLIDPDISAVNWLDFGFNFHEVSLESPGIRVSPERSRLISGPPEELFQWAIDSVIFQILHCVKGGQLKVLGISGGDNAGGKVTKALEDLPEIRSMFEVIISVSVSQCHSISEVQTCITEQIHRLVGTDISLPLDEALKPYKFLLILHCSNEKADLYDLKIPEHGWVVLSTPSMNAYEIMPLDLEIKMNDHLLPWKLFWENLDFVVSSDIEVIGQRLIEACHKHLLAIVLLARALNHVTDIGVWEIALQELTSSSELYSHLMEGTSEVMVRVLKFVWERKSIVTRHCMKHYATSVNEDGKLPMSSLVPFRRKNALTATEVGDVLKDLVGSFLVETVSDGCLRMRKETRDVLLSHFIPQLHPLFLQKEDLGLSEAPEVAEWDAMTINLSKNLLSEVPVKPKCPSLVKLLLQKNYDLMVVPPLFFECMPKLQVLDLSYTSIKSLPPSISRLVSLQEFLLRGCELFMELPPEVGELSNLQVFDLEGTKITNLPCEIKKLTKLECLKVSFCGYRNICKEGKQINKRIPMGLLSGLRSLKLLSIDVNPEDKDWIGDVENFIFDLHKLRELRTVKLYLPEIRLLEEIEYVQNFKFIVGHHEQRIISCVPHAVEEEFEKQENYLKYINGESIPTEIQNALHCTSAFFLERHWNVRKLSEFGNENMVELKFCLLVECNELQTIIDREFCAQGDHKFVGKKPLLESLEYLGIHRMMKLRSIWEGPIDKGSLSRLKFLALHECPSLTTIFTLSLLGNLHNLEELIVEDCSKINSLVAPESSCFESNQLLPNLKKLSLLDLPELANISSGLCIAPKLERIIIYACPMIESLSPGELSCNNLEVIKGEIEWWSSLSWHEWSSTQQDYMASIFVELKRDASLMDQLAESGNSA